ncbi:hypothetical protein O3M35_012329 [Rhynocoris fuscipes]|uniref:Osiris 9 n=1 Tax=Rhynocoris fuscipes TaxID=488301 RepID=A0AAW1CV66_9HEMI
MVPFRSLGCMLVLCAVGCLAGEENLNSGMKVIYSVYRQCENSNDPLVCLKARAIKLVDRAINSDNIQLIDGISLIKSGEGERPVNIEPLPSDIDESRSNKVDDLLSERLAAFLQTHSIQFKIPSFVQEYLYDETDEEGRGKKKRVLPLLLLGLLFKGSLLAIAMKALALLAAKALLVSKLALVLAGIIALKKLFSSGNEKTTYEIVKQPIVSHSHEYTSSHEGGYEHGYKRSLDADIPHRLAYRAQIHQQSL